MTRVSFYPLTTDGTVSILRSMNTKYTLSEVCGAAYASKMSFLVHAVDTEGNPACKRVKAENLCGYADPKHTEPTCPTCLKRYL